MIPNKVYFTGLELDPLVLIEERCVKGVIPLEWYRYHFTVARDASYPISSLNRWLMANIEGKWAIYMNHLDVNQQDEPGITIAFENDFDGVTFVMADGKTDAFREPR